MHEKIETWNNKFSFYKYEASNRDVIESNKNKIRSKELQNYGDGLRSFIIHVSTLCHALGTLSFSNSL